MCLGPVNTGAVHALAYPLGSEFHIAHGVSNAVLLPHVLEFNLASAPDRYAQIAQAFTPASGNLVETIRRLSQQTGIPQRLRDLNIPESAIERMAASAVTITRLLERNVRKVTLQDAINIYRRAF
jgi:alcohol dehydrogenase class IV